MKIAVPVNSNLQIDGHFGHCESYVVFTIDEAKQIIAQESVASPEGCGCKSNIASVFEASGVTVMLAGGIGGGAIQKLSEHGIQVIRNCAGDAAEQVKRYLAGEVEDGGSSCAAHEDHHANEQKHEHKHGDDHICSHNG